MGANAIQPRDHVTANMGSDVGILEGVAETCRAGRNVALPSITNMCHCRDSLALMQDAGTRSSSFHLALAAVIIILQNRAL